METATEAISKAREARHHGDFAVARAHYAEAATIYREQSDPLAYAHAIRHIAISISRNQTSYKPNRYTKNVWNCTATT